MTHWHDLIRMRNVDNDKAPRIRNEDKEIIDRIRKRLRRVNSATNGLPKPASKQKLINHKSPEKSR
jgi:hypothetical protein